MKTEKIIVTSKEQGMESALAVTEKLGKEAGLDKKQALHLRLLAEELFGMLRGIAGDVKADFWVENESRRFELHMKTNVSMTDEMRRQFLASSTSGKNEAAGTFMGKIRVLIASALLSTKEALPYAMVTPATVDSVDGMAGEMATMWSMMYYKEILQAQLAKSEKAREAWDELEKSIVANIADDVKVKVVGKMVEILVIKTF